MNHKVFEIYKSMANKLNYLLIVILIFSIPGCVFNETEGPGRNIGFDRKGDLRKFEGTYENAAIQEYGDKLSIYFWPVQLWPTGSNPDEAEKIRINFKHPDILIAHALVGDSVISKIELKEGTDYAYSGGVILLQERKQTKGYEGGDAFAPFYTVEKYSLELGVDKEGHIKVRRSNSGYGGDPLTGIIPVGGKSYKDVRYERVTGQD